MTLQTLSVLQAPYSLLLFLSRREFPEESHSRRAREQSTRGQNHILNIQGADDKLGQTLQTHLKQ